MESNKKPINTSDFLPEIFKTPSNEQFLNATLDQLVDQPNFKTLQGYIGSKFGYGVEASDTYVSEPTQARTNYQLEPAVVFTAPGTSTPTDAITYPGLIDAFKTEGASINNHSALFENQFYSWDSFVDLDKMINYGQYYWLPNGPDSVEIATSSIYTKDTFTVINNNNYYDFTSPLVTFNTDNPTITLVRGGTYTFKINQGSKFWIQTQKGTSGVDLVNPNLSTRNVFGVENNGTSKGDIVFNVPLPDAQANYLFPYGINIDLVTTLAFEMVNGMPISKLKNIDGVTDLNGKTLIFYGSSATTTGKVYKEFFGEQPFDDISTPNSAFDDTEFVNVNGSYWTIALVNNVVNLVQGNPLPNDQLLVINYGDTYINRSFVRDVYGDISLVPQITSELNVLYYQDDTNPDKVGIINLIDHSTLVSVNVDTEIVGQKNYTSPNGIVFTNGLKIAFNGNIFPNTYLTGQFYVEGVGTSIVLIPVTDLIVPEPFGQVIYEAFDDTNWDIHAYSDSSNIPSTQDYITINRASLNRNAWSRSNRWFHVDVLNYVLANNNNAILVKSALSNGTARAKRPIIEFYANLKLFDSGTQALKPVDFVDFTLTDAFTQLSGQVQYSFNGQKVFDGARIIFANDSDPEVRNKIFLVNISPIVANGVNTITLSKTYDGDVTYGKQVVVLSGSEYGGQSFYLTQALNASNELVQNVWKPCQYKNKINQCPLFDIFDINGVSFGGDPLYPTIYSGSTFKGCTLLQYAPGKGPVDSILGFSLAYSSVTSVGDILFNCTFNTDSFNYVINNQSLSLPVNTGYVYLYSDGSHYTRQIGWVTTIENSFQYQVYNLTYTNNSITLDVAVNAQSTTNWPVMSVYVDNSMVDSTQYSFVIKATTTILTLNLNTIPSIGTPIEVLVYSNQTSATAYYQIPSNLDHNPFNALVSQVSLGEVRGHYQSICYNFNKFAGTIFGANNYRDLGNVIIYGTKIIQNSAPLTAAAAFIRQPQTNFFDSVRYNSLEYIKYKSLLQFTVNNNDYNPLQTPAFILDDAISQITSSLTETNSFFWSDMLPAMNAYNTKTYNFTLGINLFTFTLSRLYDFNIANYYSVLVYLNSKINGKLTTTLLIKDRDYTVNSTGSKSVLEVTVNFKQGDSITINEYYQTYGSYVPNTPTKIGLYPKFIPEVVLDSSYITPTYFIKGHDGSLTKLYGTYINGVLEDFRDQVLLEFETRIYNNIKVNAAIPLEYDDIFPGQFRKTDYTFTELNEIYSTQFLNWVGVNRITYTNQFYNSTNEFTWNYTQTRNKLDNSTIQQGNWRGVYLWLYDTANPDTNPWEMLGLTIKPAWWDTRYGSAPYTSDNTLLWTDISNGYIWNNGSSTINTKRIRQGLLDVLPVDSAGNLVSPFTSVLGGYNKNLFETDWVVGDMGPAEYSYRKSSSWPFDLMRMFALTKPGKFFALGIDLDVFRLNSEFNQYLVDNRFRAAPSQLTIYGGGINNAEHSYMNWMVDYANQFGIDGSQLITSYFQQIDVRLVYRIAGFTDKEYLKFFVEKASPNSTSISLLIPDESYKILLYQNPATATIVYSSVIVQKTEGGYRVYGNSQNNAYFIASDPINSLNTSDITVSGTTIKVANLFYATTTVVPYGEEFSDLASLGNFLVGYGNYLQTQGVQFINVENVTEVNWKQMVAELVYWANSGWQIGSTININPLANSLTIDNGESIVQPLTITQQNFVLNQNLIPIKIKDMSIQRNDTQFSVTALNSGDSISFMRANLSTMEHIAIFDNTTTFNDKIFDLVTGLRQQRLLVKGKKSADWNGTMNAAGFLINQDNVTTWKTNVKYVKGEIVDYKNSFWIANAETIQPSNTFNIQYWRPIASNALPLGMLQNPSTKAFESTLYYDTHYANLKNDADLLAFSLIGYRPRPYLVEADLTDVTQVNIYQNMIQSKGTPNAFNAFIGAKFQQSSLSYNYNENWAILRGIYGGTLNKNFIDFALNENLLTGNPSTVGVINGEGIVGLQQEVPLYQLLNYGFQIQDTGSILNTIGGTLNSSLPNAGYVNFNDVNITSYSLTSLLSTSASNLYNYDYVWVADVLGTWQVYTPISLGINLITVRNNLNGTVTFVFTGAHGLLVNQPLGVLNFNAQLDGFYTVVSVLTTTTIVVTLVLPASTIIINGEGIVFYLQSQRVSEAANISYKNLPLLNFDQITNKVWVDSDQNGNWAVYQKTNNYSLVPFSGPAATKTFGNAVAITPVGYFVTDPVAGKMYVYKQVLNKEFVLIDTIVESVNFGTAITRTDNLLIVSQPDPFLVLSKLYIYRLVNTSKVQSYLLDQTINVSGLRAGDSLTISGDGQWLYVSDIVDNEVILYQQNADYVRSDVGIRTVGIITPLSTEFNCRNDVTTFLPGGKFISFTNNSYEIEFTVITTQYNPTSNITTVYVIEPIPYTVLTNDPVFLAEVNFTVIGGITSQGLSEANDQFSYSLATNYDGSRLFVGAPNANYSDTQTNTGYVYAFNRLIESWKMPYSSPPEAFTLLLVDWNPAPNSIVYINGVRLETYYYQIILNLLLVGVSITAGDIITVSSGNVVLTQEISNYDTLQQIHSGSQFGFSLDTNTYGDEVIIGCPYDIDNITKQDGSVYRLTNEGKHYGTITAIIECNVVAPADILINNYRVPLVFEADLLLDITTSSSTITITPSVATKIAPSGTIAITGKYVDSYDGHTYTVTEFINYNINSLTDAENGLLTVTGRGQQGSSVVQTGASTTTNIFAFSAIGASIACPIGPAVNAANAINKAALPNIFAYNTEDNRLVIRLIESQLNPANNLLNLTVFDPNVLTHLGIVNYIHSQKYQDPYTQHNTQFGYAVKFNEDDSFLISSPTSNRNIWTVFDQFSTNQHTNTVFDNGFTTFIDNFASAGSVYLYEYITSYNESLTNLGNYIYAQQVNDTRASYGHQPFYGFSLDFHKGTILIGNPLFEPTTSGGQVVVYQNSTGTKDWAIYRQSSSVVDISMINKIELYNNTTNTTIAPLDYFDPLQGKLLGAIESNIDFISTVDPAGYITSNGKLLWGAAQVGKIWFDVSSTKFVNYHQNDVAYNSLYWGAVFPGSDVTIYSWISSTNPPASYKDTTGTPLNTTDYNFTYTTDVSDNLIQTYYYWVRQTNTMFKGKTLTDQILEKYIANPQASGISYIALLLPNVYGLYNATNYFYGTTTNLYIGFDTNSNNVPAHQEWQLIKSNSASDFLSGFPGSSYAEPEGLYARLINSLGGQDGTGQILPNFKLPFKLQIGINVRPGQSMFVNRLLAIKNYLLYANSILIKYPITELPNLYFLSTTDNATFYTSNYWTFADWWATGFSPNTKTNFDVPLFYYLDTLVPIEGQLVGVTSNSQGNREVYQYTNGAWLRVGLANGTIQFLSTLWDYENNAIGFGNNFFDTQPFDAYPCLETKYIIRALNEQIFTSNLLIERNNSLMLLFEYIASENVASNNYLPWLNKTSFIDVNYNIRKLLPYPIYQTDNEAILEGYLNEIKPYHVVLKEFYLNYSGIDQLNIAISDFDLPAIYNSTNQSFITPELIYGVKTSISQFTELDPIWQSNSYSDWYQSVGLILSNKPNQQVAILNSYLDIVVYAIIVSNINGLPYQGVFTIDSEQIAYSSINRNTNQLLGLTRGMNGTKVTVHFAGAPIIMDLPGVIVHDTGRAYTAPPTVSAYVDTALYPAPRRPAVLKAVMAGEFVIGVDVLDSGDGYLVTPEIIFSSSVSTTVNATSINFKFNLITINSLGFVSGDLIFFTNTQNDIGTDILNKGYYYIHVLGTEGDLSVISLHENYKYGISGEHNIVFRNIFYNSNYNYTIGISARASVSVINHLVRDMGIVVKFDRTSYQSRITPWSSGQFWPTAFIDYGNKASAAPDETKPDSLSSILSYGNIFNITSSTQYTTTTVAGTGIIFEVFNMEDTGNYQISILSTGSGYASGDSFTISGANLGGTSPANDCVITLGTVSVVNNLPVYTNVTVSGLGTNIIYASTQAITLPITQLINNNGAAVVVVDYSKTTLTPAQVKGLSGYVYKTYPTYTFDNSTPINHTDTFTANGIANSFFILAGVTIPGFGSPASAHITSITINGTNQTSSQYSLNGKKLTFISTPVLGDTIVVNSQYYGAKIQISRPVFTPGSMISQYSIFILNYGTIYSNNQQIVVKGSLLGGVDGTNDAVINITYASDLGLIEIASISGLATSAYSHYYVEPGVGPGGETEILLYKDAQLSVPVPYNGFVWDGSLGNDYVYFPEPIVISGRSYKYNVTALVSYQGVIWECQIANSDIVFDANKWKKLQSDNPALNALDRIIGYYNPSSSMTPQDLKQLMSGITYPNDVYFGNSFAPEDIVSIDTVIKGQSFYPRNVTIKSITSNGAKYVAIGNSPTESLVLITTDGENWTTVTISPQPIGLTDIIWTGSMYIITTTDLQMPLLLSFDAENWLSNLSTEAFDNIGFDDDEFDFPSLTVPSDKIQSITYNNGIYITAGVDIMSSSNGYIWNQVISFTDQYIFYDLKFITLVNYTGYVAVGVGLQTTTGQNTAAIQQQKSAAIVTSFDGINWIPFTTIFTKNVMYALCQSPLLMVMAGENAELWYSYNTSNWIGGSIAGSSISDTINSIAYGNRIFVAVGNAGTILISNNGKNWTQQTNSELTVENLNKVIFANGNFYAVGDNTTILISTVGTTWTNLSFVAQNQIQYDIKGSDFLSGYGPEELVAGIVTDTLSMTVTTMPGAFWDNDLYTQSELYYHTGFNMQTLITQLTNNLKISFAGLVENPAQLSVFVMDSVNQSTRIYENHSVSNGLGSYSINWINKTITLSEYLDPSHQIMIEVYEVGNGKQLARNNSDNTPLIINPNTNLQAFDLGLIYAGVINDPVVYHNGVKLVYNTDYTIVASATNSTLIQFVNTYDVKTDYLSFCFLDNNLSDYNQSDLIGYSIPETQIFTYSGSNIFALSNYVGMDNATNAIVELNGLRLLPTAYTIDSIAKTLTVTANMTLGDTVAITSFNDTQRQYLTTTYTSSGSSATVTITQPTVAFNTGTVTVNYTNGARTWVTINGHRVNPALLSFSSGNILTIGTPVNASDIIIVTTFVSSATPNQMIYNLAVDKAGNASVYTINNTYQSWLTQPLLSSDTTIYVHDVLKLVNTTTQNLVVQSNNGVLYVTIQNVSPIVDIHIYNSSSLVYLNKTQYQLSSINNQPVIVFQSGVALNDNLTVDLRVGKILQISGERISFLTIDHTSNSLSGLTRGIQGTSSHLEYAVNTPIFALLSVNKMPDSYYGVQWVSSQFGAFNDPLQISIGNSAQFLQQGT